MIETERLDGLNEDSARTSGQDGKTMSDGESFPMIAKTMAELEDVLAEELIALGADDVEIGTRMVSFTGDKSVMYKANVHCRTALRILKPIYSFKANSADEVYDAVKEFNWEEWLSLETTFSIDSVVFSHIFTHSKFVTYRVKDAIADWFFERYEKRPSVSVSNPDIVLHVHISHNKCTLSLDSSGESLHKRGYRLAQTEAPLNEVLAAGMILKSGWHGERPFVDPMCGSGTLLIEAAMIALGIPPGIHRQHFGFEKWGDFDQDLFSAIYNDDSGARELSHPIIGSDISAKAISIAERNIKNAGLKKYIELGVKPFQQYTEAPASNGVLITNPPYGERMRVEELDSLYAMIGERMKHVFTGYDAFVLSYRKESFDAIGLRHSKRYFLYNGALECEMREYEIFSGKRDDLTERDGTRDKRVHESDHYKRNSREGYRRSQRAGQEEGNKPEHRSDRPSRPDRFDHREDRPYKRSFDSGNKSGSRPADRPARGSESKPAGRPARGSGSKPAGSTEGRPGRPGGKPFKPGGSGFKRGSSNRPNRDKAKDD